MIKLEGTFMRCGVKNANGRTYDSSIMQQAIKDYQKKVADNVAYGYFNDDAVPLMGDITHPSDSIAQITHKVTELNFDEETGMLFGKIQLLDTPQGKIAQTIVSEMGEMGVAPAMLASINEDGVVEEVDEIRSFNLCNNPAWSEAKMKPIKE